MDKHIERMMAIEKIDRSINQCQTLEQLGNTEHFLRLYYQLYPFSTKYFRYEWSLDGKLKNRRIHLSLLEGIDEEDIVVSKERISLKRLNTYVQVLSLEELKAAWTELRPQLEGVDMSLYPALKERIAFLRLPAIRPGQGTRFQPVLRNVRQLLSAN